MKQLQMFDSILSAETKADNITTIDVAASVHHHNGNALLGEVFRIFFIPIKWNGQEWLELENYAVEAKHIDEAKKIFKNKFPDVYNKYERIRWTISLV
jgi:hypothetical protein